MKVRYNRTLAFTLLGLGLLCLLLNLWVAALAGIEATLPGLITGLIVTFVGVLYLRTPIFELAPDHIAAYQPIGAVGKRYPFKTRTEIKIERGRVLVGGQKLSIPRWMADKTDWEAFERAIAA